MDDASSVPSSGSRPGTTPELGSRDLQQPSAAERRRSLISERPRTSTSAILRSYSSSSFESPDEDDSDSDWDNEEPTEITTVHTREVA